MSIACVHRVILVPALAAAAATAAAPPADIGGVYSSLRTSEETGDTGGMRIILLASDRADALPLPPGRERVGVRVGSRI